MGNSVVGMAVHRLLAVVLVIAMTSTMAADGGDGDHDPGAVESILEATNQGQDGLAGAEGARSRKSNGKKDLGERGKSQDKEDRRGSKRVYNRRRADRRARVSKPVSKPTFYKHCNFGGHAMGLTVSTNDVRRVGIKNNDVSSLKVPAGWRVELYAHLRYLGSQKLSFGPGAYRCLVHYKRGRGNWNDAVSSIRILRTNVRKNKNNREKKTKEGGTKRKLAATAERNNKNKARKEKAAKAKARRRQKSHEKHAKSARAAAVRAKLAERKTKRAKESRAKAVARKEKKTKLVERMKKVKEKWNKKAREKRGKSERRAKAAKRAAVAAGERKRKLKAARVAREKANKAVRNAKRERSKKNAAKRESA